MQTVAETGFPGLILVVAMLMTFLIVGAIRTIRAPPERRFLLAAATAAVVVFCTSAAYEWVWQLGAVTSLMLLLGAVCVIGGDRARQAEKGAPAPEAATTPPRRRAAIQSWLARGALTLVAGAAIITISLPMAEAEDLASSQTAAQRGNLSLALADARSAERVQPYAASARLQEAVVREQLGDLAGARAAALTATRDEGTNWQTWVVLARIEAELGNGHSALADFTRAHSLDPQGNLFHP
jgi:tetratricopeptide (TPR) repeat protein